MVNIVRATKGSAVIRITQIEFYNRLYLSLNEVSQPSALFSSAALVATIVVWSSWRNVEKSQCYYCDYCYYCY